MDNRPPDNLPTNTVQGSPSRRSRVGAVWISLLVFVFILLFLMIFVLQNGTSVRIHYLGTNGSVGFGVAILLSAVAGSILTLLVGSVRILQLKISNKKHSNS